LGEGLAVGHEPAQSLSPQDEALFRAFQSNLLSLVSHELKTPLTGILNALGALDEGAIMPGLTPEDLIKMARENAVRLNQALNALLDLAALESGSYHVRLREVDLGRIVEGRFQNCENLLKSRNLELEIVKDKQGPLILLGDPQKLSRAIDLCFQVVIPRAKQGTSVRVRMSSKSVTFIFQLAQEMEKLWETSWSQSVIGFHSGITSPYSAFGGVMQSEQAFLSRVEDGFGSEFLLIHEIMKLHNGKFSAILNDKIVELGVELPELSSEEGLRTVLKSRAFQVSSELNAVTLVLIRVPESIEQEDLREKVRKNLSRSTDAVYQLPDPHRLAIVLDDCTPDEVPRVMTRISQKIELNLDYSVAHCPGDSLDPTELLDLAEGRLKKSFLAAS